MAYNFKNIADVELLGAMPETANVLVEVDGTTKRAPQVKPVDEIAKIVTSESLAEVPDGATVIAEVGGEIKRVPGDELGGKGMVVNFTYGDTSNYTTDASPTIIADKTYEEIKTALREGRHIIGLMSTSHSDIPDITFNLSYNAIFVEYSDGEMTKGIILFYTISILKGKGQKLDVLMMGLDNSIIAEEMLRIPDTTTLIENGSPDVITSGAVYTALQAKQDTITNQIILNSSTTDSTKKFKITVDDSGTLTATEVTA